MRRSLRFPLLLAMIAPALGLATTASAQCFCLAHPINGEIYRFECSARAIPGGGLERVQCRNAERTEWLIVREYAQFDRVPDGEGQCNPCAPPPDKVPGDIPRKPDEAETQE